MVRTKADALTTRVAGSKAPRKNIGGGSNFQNLNANTDKKGREQSGGNSYFPRETPEWQKPITSFFNRPQESGESHTERNQRMEFVDGDLAAGASTSGASTSKEDKTD